MADYTALLDAYGAAEFRSPWRSTVPLLAYWRAADVALSTLESALGGTLDRPVTLAFEHRVPVQGGRGTASHTDLLVSTPSHAVGIEAKSTEPAYESVARWLGAEPTESRRAVLDGWLGLISNAVGTSLRPEAVADCTYQLIHRTASVCATPAPWRAVVYQCFDVAPAARDVYLSQMRSLHALSGNPPGLSFHLLNCVSQPTSRLAALRARWDRGERDLSAEVTAGLRDDDLMRAADCTGVRA